MKVIVSGEYNNDLRIQFSQGTWNVTFFTLFENQKVVSVDFPRDPTLFRLSIRYDSENYYLENILYTSNPNLDNLKFHFYKENSRIFCRIESEIVIELNKEIVLNPLASDLKELKNIMENFQKDSEIS
ncbi:MULTISPECIES: hypothetical protein [Flavobacterium]|uniref:Uncharacterized protein n=1 Tax=Flavobacterium salmonis TaxID=2654844 RepID=A0A6V6Z126_9FLAO|nr:MULTISPECIES: hypothetical protein [Flavobacterium]OOV18638.1 hypothetical protein BXU10_02755 [Flavobacterium sp. LM4]CAD0005184.1 hypothetical protein FLAT13_02622 [Flavobacterium salmonis]